MAKMCKLSDFKKNSENPFLKQALVRVEENVVKKLKTLGKSNKNAVLQAYNAETGEMVGHTQFIKQIEVDNDQFTKIYLANFSAFFNLNTQAIRVLGYIMTKLIPNKDDFIFEREDCMEYTGYKSDKSVFLGLACLLESEIIARGKTDYRYYINPMLLFNGDRLTFAKTYIKKKVVKPSEIAGNQTYMDFDEMGNIDIKRHDGLDV